MLSFSTMTVADYMAIERQPSQAMLLGQSAEPDHDEAEALAAQRLSWTARHEGRLLACFGIAETFPGAHGIAWAVLAPGIGSAHVELTRFCRALVQGSGMGRVEMLARARDIEPLLDEHPEWDTGMAVAVAMAEPTPEIRWGMMLGFRPAHVLRRYGAAAECCMLMEWLPPRWQAALAPSNMVEAA